MTYLFFLLLFSLGLCNRPSPINYNPVAASEAMVVLDKFRFTILTERLIRIEASELGTFEDRATLAVLNRQLDVPEFRAQQVGDILTIHTGYFQLNMTVSQGLQSLVISPTSLSALSKFTPWKYGQTNSGTRNLFGTIRSLDEIGPMTLNCTENAEVEVHHEGLHCEWGLVSRDGWAIYDDTHSPCLDENDWWAGNNSDVVDLYFFGHGLDFAAALFDYSQVGGRIMMPPRSAFGVWWSRWYDVNNKDVQEIVGEYESHDLPLDIYVLDMDWHKKPGWSGYSWDERLFPFPTDTLAFLHEKGLLVSANLHDRDGVGNYDSMFVPFAKYVGLDPNKVTVVPLNLVNETWAYGLEDIVLQDVEKMGMDFWWLDWQQGDRVGGLTGGKQNPTIWTNHLRCTDRHRRGDPTRAMVLARFGGMGSHRYQVGFSGDIQLVSWRDLAYQPYFSWTASNVGFGFWSHDIVGPDASPLNYDLYTRWVQWGAMSGVMRSHDRGLSAGLCNDVQPSVCGVVEPWNIPQKYFKAVRHALRQRASLGPYIYTAIRQAFDTGVSLIRPMYYYWPLEPMAYAGDPAGNYAQYMFGNELLVAPIVEPLSPSNNLAFKMVWLPPGEWIDFHRGNRYVVPNGANVSRWYDQREIPMWVLANAVIPYLPVDQLPSLIGVGKDPPAFLGFDFFPSLGDCSGVGVLYEDDGKTTAYLQNKVAWTTAQFVRKHVGRLTTTSIELSTLGSFPELPATRALQIRLNNVFPPSGVFMPNNKTVPYCRFCGLKPQIPSSPSWRWSNFRLIVDVDPRDLESGFMIRVEEQIPDSDLRFGMAGVLRNANWAKQNLDEDRKNPGDIGAGEPNPGVGYLSMLASAGEALTYLAGSSDQTQWQNVFAQLPDLLHNASAEVSQIPPLLSNPARIPYSLGLLA